MVGLGILILLILPAEVLIGHLASLMPAGLAVIIVGAAMFCGVISGTRILAAKISKR